MLATADQQQSLGNGVNLEADIFEHSGAESDTPVEQEGWVHQFLIEHVIGIRPDMLASASRVPRARNGRPAEIYDKVMTGLVSKATLLAHRSFENCAPNFFGGLADLDYDVKASPTLIVTSKPPFSRIDSSRASTHREIVHQLFFGGVADLDYDVKALFLAHRLHREKVHQLSRRFRRPCI